MEGRGKWSAFFALSASRPRPVKSFKSRDREMECRHIVRRKCLLCIVGMLISLSGIDIQKTRLKCTLSKPRNVSTRSHSSLVSFSSRSLSRFAKSCSSQRSSSTKASTYCEIQIMFRDPLLMICYAPLFFFRHDQASYRLMTIVPSCQVSVGLALTPHLLSFVWFSTSLSALLMNVPERQ
jgi:hypothetical protein